MPQEVKREVKVTALRVGDLIVSADGHHDTVVSVERKIKYAYLTVRVEVHGKREVQRHPLDATVVVLREEPTEEERAAEDRAFLINWLNHMMIGNIERLENILLTLHTSVRDAPTYAVPIDSWKLTDLAEAQAVRKPWLELKHYLVNLTSGDQEKRLGRLGGDIVTALAVMRVVRDSRKERLTLSAPSSPLSRSTSVMSNLLEDLDVWAEKRFWAEVGWRSEGILKVEVARVRAFFDAEDEAKS